MKDDEDYEEVSSKNKTIGLFLIIGPFVLLFLVLMSYAILGFVIDSLVITGPAAEVASQGDFYNTLPGSVLQIISVVLGLLGVIGVIGIIFGIPLGIYFLNKKNPVKGVKFDHRSGPGGDEIPEEIKGWNWGAAGLTWIWGVFNGVWISLLVFIPFVNIVMIFVLGAKGNEWAWRAKKWQSVEHFQETQAKWKPWGILFFILSMLGIAMQLAEFASY